MRRTYQRRVELHSPEGAIPLEVGQHVHSFVGNGHRWFITGILHDVPEDERLEVDLDVPDLLIAQQGLVVILQTRVSLTNLECDPAVGGNDIIVDVHVDFSHFVEPAKMNSFPPSLISQCLHMAGYKDRVNPLRCSFNQETEITMGEFP